MTHKGPRRCSPFPETSVCTTARHRCDQGTSHGCTLNNSTLMSEDDPLGLRHGNTFILHPLSQPPLCLLNLLSVMHECVAPPMPAAAKDSPLCARMG